MIKMPAVEVEYIRFAGGIDLASPVFSIKPGFLLDCVNYEPGINGGYRRIDGYERFDGRTRPSTASYWLMPCTITGTIAAGDTVTGVTSSVTGKVLQVNADDLVLGRVSGTFDSAETINVGGSPVATTTGATNANTATTSLLHVTYKSLAANDYRADIGAVPGSGNILGAVMYNDVLYAFRNNAAGTATDLYKSTSSGWTQVNFEYEVSFTGGGGATPADGATLTQGAVTATVRRVVTRTGAWGGTAAGTLVISAPSGGNFAAGAATISGGVTLTLSGAQTAITLNPSGRYEFRIANFFGQQDKLRLYGVDGKNPAFEFDGSYYVPIHTGMTTDTPTHLAVHKKHLFLSFKSSVQTSGIGDPYSHTAVAGASEIAVGETVTGFDAQPGEVLAIFTRNSAYQLLGSSSADWKLDMITPDNGAIEHTIQNVGYSFMLDDRGIIKIAQSLNYGNFESATMSRIIQPAIDALRPKAIASTVYRARNQYRLYGNDGSGVIMGLDNGKVTGLTKFEYPDIPTCVWSGEGSTGAERIFFGDGSGYVYEANVGTSFDGERIDSFVFPPHNTSRNPRYRKQYRKVVLELIADEYSEIKFFPEFSYGDLDISSHDVVDVTAESGVGGYWDISSWDTFFYDGKSTAMPEYSIAGAGNSMSAIFYSRSAIDPGHTLSGMMVHYTVRRISR